MTLDIEKLDPDDDGVVILSDLKDFLKENGVNKSLSAAKYILEEASTRGNFY
jgi:hypothetical protein